MKDAKNKGPNYRTIAQDFLPACVAALGKAKGVELASAMADAWHDAEEFGDAECLRGTFGERTAAQMMDLLSADEKQAATA